MTPRSAVTALACVVLGMSRYADAGPTDAINPIVQTGSATVSGLGTSHIEVNQTSQLAKIHWDSLGNHAGDILRFNQPSASSWTFNLVGGADPTQLLGNVFANGSVIFVNPNGVFFGPGSQVNVNGLIASSLNLSDSSFLGGQYAFSGTAANGLVRNDGQIVAGAAGVYLVGPSVTNNGQLASTGGHVVLAAGTTAYLSDRADGRGFLVEVKAPAGEALNLGSLTADGGQVSMIGRLVTQSGLVQANSVQNRNGVIKLVASEQATLSPGSRTIADGGGITVSGRVIEQQGLIQSIGTASQSGRIELIATDQVNFRSGSKTTVKGGDVDVADGGTIAAMARNPANGTVTIENGAELDLSGGAQGGHGGELWLGGVSIPSTVSFMSNVLANYQPGSLRIIPRSATVTAADLTGGATRSYLNFYAVDDLTVNVVNFNLASRTIATMLDGSARTGTLRFFAGNNLNIAPSLIQNGNRNPTASTGTVNPWNFVGEAGNDIQFQTVTGQTSVWSTGKGSISLQAGRDIKFVPDGGGGATTIQTFDGDIAMTAGRDIIAPSALVNNLYTGIRLDRVVVNATPDQGVGNLSLTAGGNFTGAKVNGVETGPGFVLSNGTATVRVGGDLGSSSDYGTFTVGSAGIALGGTTPIANSQTTVKLDVVAQGNMSIGNVQDRGVSEGLRNASQNFSTAHQNNAASFTSINGDIHLRPADIKVTNGQDRSRSHLLPSAFTASAPNGNIFVENLLEFWSSPVGSLNFLAGQSIQGSIVAGSFTNIALSCDSTCNPIIQPASSAVSPITLTAGHDISGLNLRFVDPFLKTVNISAGGNISNVSGTFAVPGLTKDASGKPVPASGNLASEDLVPAVSITAGGNIDFSKSVPAPNSPPDSNSGFTFSGTGLARVTVGGKLDLGQSQGMVFQYDPKGSADNATKSNLGGLLEVSSGGDIAMTLSRIQSSNGAAIFLHGLSAQAPMSGTTAMATSRIVGGNPVYVVGGNTVLDSAGAPVVVGANDTIVGHSVLMVNGTAVLGLNGKPIVVDNAASNVITAADLVHGTAVLDRQLVQLADGTIVAVINGKTVLATSPGGPPVNGHPSENNGVVTLLVDGKSTNVVEPIGGKVDVGALTQKDVVTAGQNFRTGILTVRGGAIDVKATGDINVNRSRIATLGGGDITLTSTAGNINAGSGPKNEVTNFVIDQKIVDVNGNTVTRPFLFSVPGSGIFTFHPDDGNLPNIPPFDPLSPFHKLVIMHEFLGHDVSKLLPLVPAADAAWRNQYDQSVRQLFAGFKLGDITLKASHDVIVPPAGIRGRYITIDAGHNLDLQGGQIRGVSTVNVGSQVVGSLTGFVGAFVVNLAGVSGGTGSTLGLGSITGNVGNVTTTPGVTASTSTSALTSSKSAEDAQVSRPVNEPKTVSDRNEKKGGGLGGASLRIKDKVKIKVETKQEPGM